jgi:hypothetical protein
LYDQIPSKKLKKTTPSFFQKSSRRKTKQLKSIPRNNQQYNRQETTAGKKNSLKHNQGKISKGKNHSKKITNPRIFMKTKSLSDFFQYQYTNYHSDPTRNQTSLKSCISTFSSVLE